MQYVKAYKHEEMIIWCLTETLHYCSLPYLTQRISIVVLLPNPVKARIYVRMDFFVCFANAGLPGFLGRGEEKQDRSIR